METVSPAVPAEKKPFSKTVREGLRGPLRAVFLENEAVVLVVKQTQHAIFLMLFDDHVAANGEVDDGSGDVAHVDGVIDEGANFAWSELDRAARIVRRWTKARIAAACPP